MDSVNFSEMLRQIPVDLRSEVVARELIDAGLSDPDRTFIVPREAFKRSYSREVSMLEDQFEPFEETKKAIRIIASREGIVDMIPPGLFYQPSAGRERSEQVMLDDAETQATGFGQAQQFFFPFDVEAGRLRVEFERFENRLASNADFAFDDQLFELLWPNLDLELDVSQKSALLDLGFRLGHIAGDLGQVAAEIKKILQVPVRIRQVEKQEKEEPPALMPLGKSILGVSWAPFEDFADTENMILEIGPLNYTEMPHFRHHEPEGKNYRLLKFLCDLLLPVEISWQIVLVPGEPAFVIGKKNELGILSYSTILG